MGDFPCLFVFAYFKYWNSSSCVTQATITDESVSADKTVQEKVCAGTLNEEGLIRNDIMKLVEDTTIAKTIGLVEEVPVECA
ncbi:hypothetical protein EK386_10600 [Lysinibacillus antri]|uniref:P-type ATPase A domain-containing protein n=1 Tax=Lysinibacillus antri TaxID=2498145 RepID=A0A432LBD4_9BACI|nr:MULTISPECIES: hypothetical protein [Lysinibacillus]RUL52037.1 hypothetical protein EK386_10600 [Lysinibacillus antri]TSI05970.1 hypothetical protein FJQ64_11215 [Lysinibacillus sp. BW-2-10]